MGRIILPDESGRFPSTFADDSYADNLKVSTVTVLAQFPDHADLTWHFELLSHLRRREIKYAGFRRYRDQLPRDVVRRVLRGLRKAVIAISDDREHRLKMQAILENVAKKPLRSLDPHIQDYFDRVISRYADEMVLLHSPLWQVETFLGGGDIDDFRRYVKTLENPRNVRVFACRATGAFFEVIDPNSKRKALDELAEFRYFSRGSLQSRLMQAAGVPTRVFDKGNEKVSGLIRSLRQEVHNRIEQTEYLLIPEGVGIVEEMDSKISTEVGASDIAAGYARDLYESPDGGRKVADAFDLALLNGEVLQR